MGLIHIEIYNEVLNDLLNLSASNLKIREDQTSPLGSYVEGLSMIKIKDIDHFMKIFAKGKINFETRLSNFY